MWGGESAAAPGSEGEDRRGIRPETVRLVSGLLYDIEKRTLVTPSTLPSCFLSFNICTAFSVLYQYYFYFLRR